MKGVMVMNRIKKFFATMLAGSLVLATVVGNNVWDIADAAEDYNVADGFTMFVELVDSYGVVYETSVDSYIVSKVTDPYTITDISSRSDMEYMSRVDIIPYTTVNDEVICTDIEEFLSDPVGVGKYVDTDNAFYVYRCGRYAVASPSLTYVGTEETYAYYDVTADELSMYYSTIGDSGLTYGVPSVYYMPDDVSASDAGMILYDGADMLYLVMYATVRDKEISEVLSLINNRSIWNYAMPLVFYNNETYVLSKPSSSISSLSAIKSFYTNTEAVARRYVYPKFRYLDYAKYMDRGVVTISTDDGTLFDVWLQMLRQLDKEGFLDEPFKIKLGADSRKYRLNELHNVYSVGSEMHLQTFALTPEDNDKMIPRSEIKTYIGYDVSYEISADYQDSESLDVNIPNGIGCSYELIHNYAVDTGYVTRNINIDTTRVERPNAIMVIWPDLQSYTTVHVDNVQYIYGDGSEHEIWKCEPNGLPAEFSLMPIRQLEIGGKMYKARTTGEIDMTGLKAKESAVVGYKTSKEEVGVKEYNFSVDKGSTLIEYLDPDTNKVKYVGDLEDTFLYEVKTTDVLNPEAIVSSEKLINNKTEASWVYKENVSFSSWVSGSAGIEMVTSIGSPYVFNYMPLDGKHFCTGETFAGRLVYLFTTDRILEEGEVPVDIDCSILATTVSIQVPINVSVNINPNDKVNPVVCGELKVINDTTAPVSVKAGKFVQVGNTFENLVRGSDSISWDTLSAGDTAKYFALGIKPKDDNSWRSREEQDYLWCGYSNNLAIGELSARSEGNFDIQVLSGRSFKEAKVFKFDLVLIAELAEY